MNYSDVQTYTLFLTAAHGKYGSCVSPKKLLIGCHTSLRTADAFPVVASLPPKNLFFGGREATTGNASAVRRLLPHKNIVNLLSADHNLFLFLNGLFRSSAVPSLEKI